MINIHKDSNNEPQSWIDYRKTPGVAYSPSPDLRISLLEEQGHICAFCMRRIPVQDHAVKEHSKIAHLLSRTNHESKQLHYNNMVLSCPGNIDGNPHCDNAQGSTDITIPIFSSKFQNSINYSSKDGKIQSNNNEWDHQICDVLRLNNKLLMSNRTQTLDGVIQVLNSRSWSERELKRQLEKWENNDKSGKKHPFCGIVIWYLKKKLDK